jgi:hypothetical protein
VKKITQDELLEWIKKTCDSQGLDPHITDPTVIHNISILLRSND